MGVEERLNQIVENEGAVHLTLIDPDSQPPAVAGKIAAQAASGGTDAIMVGGSTGATGVTVEETVKAIKAECSLPVILFPANAAGVSESADAMRYLEEGHARGKVIVTVGGGQ